MPTFTDADINRLFKRRYLPYAKTFYANYDAFLRDLRKEKGGFGQDMFQTHSLSQAGSVGGGGGAGLAPIVTTSKRVQASFQPTKAYAACLLDHYTVEASRSSEDAMVRVLDEEVMGKIESFNRNRSRNFFNDSTGVLCQFSGAASNTSGGVATVDVEVTVLNTGRYRRRQLHLEPRDYVQIGVGASAPPFATPALPSKFEIVSYNKSTGLLRLSRKTGSDDLTTLAAGTYNVYMQDSQNGDAIGLLNMCFDTTLNGITRQYRYEPRTITGTTDGDVGDANLDISMITEIFDGYNADTQQSFTDIIMSPIQMRKLKVALMDRGVAIQDVERGVTDSKGEKTGIKAGVTGIKYFGGGSSCVMRQHSMLRDDMIVFVNRDHQFIRHLFEPAWLKTGLTDGTIFTRTPGTSDYSALYASYYQNILHPYHIGFIAGLNVTEN